MSRRSIVYVDGFNLYYGAIRGSPHRWLDLQRYFTLLRQGDDLKQIKYFTALINGPRQCHQTMYLTALETLPLIQIVLGKFKTKQIECRVQGCGHPGSRMFDSAEEKQTDVNIALHMLDDAYNDRCDRLVVVSGDSDLVPAMRLVKSKWPAKQVVVYVPSMHPNRGAAVEIRTSADKHRTLPLELLRHCHLPATIQSAAGPIQKPKGW